ncbi:MAG: transcription elongation factor GreA [Rhodothermales bacterium]
MAFSVSGRSGSACTFFDLEPMDKPVYLTPEGFEKLKAEVKFMISKERQRISAEIAEAREKGDLSENAEYDAAKEAQGLLEAKIAKAQTNLANARVVDESLMDTSRALILSNVKVKNKANGMEQTYMLTSAAEADFAKGRISVTSPIGKGLLGKEVGDIVSIKVPSGSVEFEVVSISRA